MFVIPKYLGSGMAAKPKMIGSSIVVRLMRVGLAIMPDLHLGLPDLCLGLPDPNSWVKKF
jgi:hypothetical protein